MNRIEKLLAAMTLEEKIGQLNMVAAGYAVTGPVLASGTAKGIGAGQIGSLLNLWGAPEVHAMQKIAVEKTRLGIPLLIGFDVLHGHKTIFPIPLAEAASFDPLLWEESARAAAIEAAADGITYGLRAHARCGARSALGADRRGAGRRPLASAAEFAKAKVRGFQGADLPERPMRRPCRRRHGQAFLRLWRGPCRSRLCLGGCLRASFARSLLTAIRGGGGRRLRRDHAGLQRYRGHSDDRPYSLAARLAAPRGALRRRDRQRL